MSTAQEQTFDEYVKDYAKRLADQLPPITDDEAARWARMLGYKRPPKR